MLVNIFLFNVSFFHSSTIDFWLMYQLLLRRYRLQITYCLKLYLININQHKCTCWMFQVRQLPCFARRGNSKIEVGCVWLPCHHLFCWQLTEWAVLDELTSRIVQASNQKKTSRRVITKRKKSVCERSQVVKCRRCNLELTIT